MAKDSKLKGQEGPMDEDTKEILAEMEAEGIDTSTIIPEGESKPAPKAKDDDTDDEHDSDPELDESEEETEEEEDDESESEDDEESDEDTDDTDGDDDDEESDEDDDENKEKSKGKLTLVQKYRKEKSKRKELETTLATLQQTKSDEAFDAEVVEFAKKSGMNLDVAKGFLELAAKKAGLPKDLMEDIQRSRKERRESDYWSSQHKQFDKDFRDNVQPVLQSLGKSKEEIKTLYDQLNTDDKSPLWAWSPKNKSTSLVKLALSLTRDKTTRHSSEGNAGKSFNRGKSSKSPEEMTGEDINEMSDEDFDTYSDSLGKSSKTSIHRS